MKRVSEAPDWTGPGVGVPWTSPASGVLEIWLQGQRRCGLCSQPAILAILARPAPRRVDGGHSPRCWSLSTGRRQRRDTWACLESATSTGTRRRRRDTPFGLRTRVSSRAAFRSPAIVGQRGYVRCSRVGRRARCRRMVKRCEFAGGVVSAERGAPSSQRVGRAPNVVRRTTFGERALMTV